MTVTAEFRVPVWWHKSGARFRCRASCWILAWFSGYLYITGRLCGKDLNHEKAQASICANLLGESLKAIYDFMYTSGGRFDSICS